jgi:hypothetical protein
MLTSKDILDTELIAIYATKWKYKATDSFIGMTAGLGDSSIDSAITVLGVVNRSLQNTKLQAYYYMVPDFMP